jgi:hypothetical protein
MNYYEQLNKNANAREKLMIYMNNMQITSLDSIKFQASILVQLTQAANQLTRKTSVNKLFLLFFSYFIHNFRLLHQINVINYLRFWNQMPLKLLPKMFS